jgi:Tol biopolymer transport system component
MSSSRIVLLGTLLALAAGCGEGTINNGSVTIATTVRASISSAGAEGSGASWSPGLSADGTLVVFSSDAPNLVPADANGNARDVFVRDTRSNTTRLVSLSSAGVQDADGFSDAPAISADGVFVVFRSTADDLVIPATTPGRSHVYRHNLLTGATVLVSVNTSGAEADSSSFSPSVSGDGRYVAFSSQATDLVIGDSNGLGDIFVRDLTLGVTTRVSVGPGGVEANGGSTAPALSNDGGFVAFESLATNLAGADTNGFIDIYRRDIFGSTTTRVSVATAGEPDADCTQPSISSNGRLVAFTSSATNLVATDTAGTFEVFVRDVVAALTTLESLNSAGFGTITNSSFPFLSRSGRWLIFYSQGADLVPSDTNGKVDVFLRDRTAGTTIRISVRTYGDQADGDDPTVLQGIVPALIRSAISDDGRFVTFTSQSSTIVDGDANSVFDVILRGPLQ